MSSLHHGAQLLLVVDDADVERDALATSPRRSASRSAGTCSSGDSRSRAGLHDLELGRQDAVLAAAPSCASALSSAMRQRRRVRAGVRDAEQLAQRRHLRLAVAALDALGDVEDQVDVGLGRAAAAARRWPRSGRRCGRSARARRGWRRWSRAGRTRPRRRCPPWVDALDVVGEADAQRLRPCAAGVRRAGSRVAAPSAARAAFDDRVRCVAVVGQAACAARREQRRRPAPATAAR